MAELPAREAMEFDVVVVGAGPAGLAAAIRLKQISAGHLRGGGGEGLRGRRPYPLRRGDRSGRPRPSAAGLALRRYADQDRGHRRPLLLPVRRRRAAAAEFHDAAADEQSRQFHRLARQCLPLARDQGGRRSASKSTRALPRRKFSTTKTARLPASPPATWASARTASRRTASPAAWSCAPNTRCSRKARAAISASN